MAKKTTAATSKALAAAHSTVELLRANSMQLALGAELELRRIASETASDQSYRLTLHPASEAVLRAAGLGHLIEDRTEMRRELDRINREAQLRAAAGNADSYQAATEAAQAAQREHDERAPQIVEAIVRLQRELGELEARTTAATGKVEEMTRARAFLKNQAPLFIRKEVEWRQKQVQYERSQAIADLEDRVGKLRAIVSADTSQTQSAIWIAQLHGRQDLIKTEWYQQRVKSREIDVAGWDQWRFEAQAELDQEEERLAHLRSAFDGAMRQAVQPLDAYVAAACESESWPDAWHYVEERAA